MEYEKGDRMKFVFNFKKIILVLIVAGLIAASFVLYERVSLEAENNKVNVVLDYYEIYEMSMQSEQSIDWWLREFREMGVEYVALKEESLNSMVQEGRSLNVMIPTDITTSINWEKNHPVKLVNMIRNNEVSEYDVIVITRKEGIFNQITSVLKNRYSSGLFKGFSSEEYFVIVINGTKEDALFNTGNIIVDSKNRAFRTEPQIVSSTLKQLGLGLDKKKVQLIQDSGLTVMPRPYGFQRLANQHVLEATIREYDELGINPSVFIFDGDSVIGYPYYLENTIDIMKERNIKAALIEASGMNTNIEQDGLSYLVTSLNYNVTRVFSMPQFIQERFAHFNYEGAEEIENTLYRAVTGRNIRLIYFRPFMIDRNTYVTDIEKYHRMFESFERRLEKHGMYFGKSIDMEPISVRNRYLVLIGWAIVAAGMILVRASIQLKNKTSIVLLMIGLLGIIGLVVVVPIYADKLIALVGAVTFSSLSMMYYCKTARKYAIGEYGDVGSIKTTLIATKSLLTMSAISIIGALFVAASLADIRFFIGIDEFRGVKFSHFIPLVVYVLLYLRYFGYKKDNEIDKKPYIELDDIKRILNENIKIAYAIITFAVLLVGYIYISRTGNDASIQPLELEMMARNFLEKNLLARPRTKEFLIAFPALIMGIVFAMKKSNKLIFAFGVIAVTGQTSIINTFSHLKAPVYLSFVRTLYSLGIGIIIGLIATQMILLGYKLLKTYMQPSKEDR